MDCLEVRKNILLYLDNELSPEETRGIRQHLDGCPCCARRAEQEERFQHLLREQLAPRPAPPGLRDRICARLAEETEPRPRTFWPEFLRRSRPALATGLAVLLMLVVLGSFARRGMAPAGPEVGVRAQVRGHLVCIQCDRAMIPIWLQKKCRAFGHQTGLKTEDGRILHLVDTEAAASLLSDPSLRGRELEVEGTLYRSIATLDVRRHSSL